jgi:hypothetical protein
MYEFILQSQCTYRDPARVTASLGDGASPQIARTAIERGHALANVMLTEAARYETLRSVIARVEVSDSAIHVAIDIDGLGAQLCVGPLHPVESLRSTIAAELRRLGKEKRLIVAAHAPAANPDPVLIKALVKAHRWFNMLKGGEVESISDLARVEDVQRTYPSRIIPLAFLAPDIAEAILEGRQPVDLSLDRLLETMPLPLGWNAQRETLGFRAR